ncbi:MAG TPA: SPOR domain-containing protein [Candidatus Acidoferrales bacterium]|jgi:cell division septation protein DedD|nr:SPOR domain-containing protein [Candidatus Acidoferrales bacterium]
MAFGDKKGSEVMLESRHVVGVFLLVVVMSGIVFTLGYVLGRGQHEPQAALGGKEVPRAGADTGEMKPGAPLAKEQPAGSASAPSDWDLYRAAGPNKPGEGKPSTQTKPAAKPGAATGTSLLNAPLIPRGATVLQVAAFTKESDALALAEALQQKKFPAFVLTPGEDHYYRVQVGPYADVPSANMAKRALENEGFKPIVRR